MRREGRTAMGREPRSRAPGSLMHSSQTIRTLRPDTSSGASDGVVVPLRRGARRRARRPAGPPPLIGVVTHELRADAAQAWAATPGRRERDLAPHRLALRLTYTQAVQEAGGIAMVMPTHGYVDDIDALLDRVDGLLFSGGPDFDPSTYGEARHPALGPDVDAVADAYELALHAAAAERDLPVLGICRGMQGLNIARGGTLVQHLPDVTALGHRQRRDLYEPTHPVTVKADSLLDRLGGAREPDVNSFHHQAVARLGAGLEVAAHAPDGIVEAVWDPAASFSLGVQWHPETLTHVPVHAALVQGLVAAARRVAVPLRAVA
jgi:putative glutamine amidotransferase